MAGVLRQGFFAPGEARATSISRSGSVRSEQRSLERKRLPPFGLRPRLGWGVLCASVPPPAPGASPPPPPPPPQAKRDATKHWPFRRHNTSRGLQSAETNPILTPRGATV